MIPVHVEIQVQLNSRLRCRPRSRFRFESRSSQSAADVCQNASENIGTCMALYSPALIRLGARSGSHNYRRAGNRNWPQVTNQQLAGNDLVGTSKQQQAI